MSPGRLAALPKPPECARCQFGNLWGAQNAFSLQTVQIPTADEFAHPTGTPTVENGNGDRLTLAVIREKSRAPG
jgi:hypothetical protein